MRFSSEKPNQANQPRLPSYEALQKVLASPASKKMQLWQINNEVKRIMKQSEQHRDARAIGGD